MAFNGKQLPSMQNRLANLLANRLAKPLRFFVSPSLGARQRPNAIFPHTHPNWELLFLENGVVCVTAPNILHDLPDVAVECTLAIDQRSLVIQFPHEDLNCRWRIPETLSAQHLAPRLLEMLVLSERNRLLANHLLASVLAALEGIVRQLDAKDLGRTAVADRQISAYVRRHYFQHDLSLNRVAETFGVSPQYINRVLHKGGCVSFHAMLTRLRLEAARGLLEHGERPVCDIARETGWESGSYFSRVFQKNYGVRPTLWRARSRRQPPENTPVPESPPPSSTPTPKRHSATAKKNSQKQNPTSPEPVVSAIQSTT